jgi:4-hydroxyphenylpyruvate dioxygenase
MLQDKVSEISPESAVEELGVDGFDHIEFFVGNALQAAYYYHQGFGFDLVAYRGLETGSRKDVSYVLKQDHVCLVLSGTLTSNTELSGHVQKHGDGVKTIALRCRDAREAYATAIARGAKPCGQPVDYSGADGVFRSGSVQTYGDTIHTFVERHEYKGSFAPGFREIKKSSGEAVGLAAIDHVVGNVDSAKMNDWVDFYKRVFGFRIYQNFDPSDISTQFSALASTVMSNKSGNVKLPINEPAVGLRKSQIQEYLDYYLAPGVQHIAISTRDIITTVSRLQARGIEFLTVPESYYEALHERVGKIDEDIKQLAKLGILVDRESDGYLLQIFTKPVQDRPTLFFEVIQRKGARGFGKGNFKALFEAIERDQSARGNL